MAARILESHTVPRRCRFLPNAEDLGINAIGNGNITIRSTQRRTLSAGPDIAAVRDDIGSGLAVLTLAFGRNQQSPETRQVVSDMQSHSLARALFPTFVGRVMHHADLPVLWQQLPSVL
ncbi:hypothetical protein BST61_g8505 [Cercospora zeina]